MRPYPPLLTTVTILIPIFACIALGWCSRQFKLLDVQFWQHAERATYYLFFPALLVSNLATAPLLSSGELPAMPMAGAIITGVLVVTGLTLFAQARVKWAGPSFSSIFQGSMRPNTYVGLAAAFALFGQEGLPLAAVAMLAIIPLVNLLCVPVVSHFGKRESCGPGHILLELCKNPILIACVLGFAINLSNLPVPESVFGTVRLLGRASLPLGLMAVGAGLVMRELPKHAGPLLLSSLLKLGALPACTWLACTLYQTPARATAVCVLFAAVPAASSSYILARQLGGDDELMAAIITGQTILSVITLPVAIYLLG